MDLSLKGKVAVVTGASKGIGFAIAKTFLVEGCCVGICARNAEELYNAKVNLEAYGSVMARQCDATCLKEVEQFARAVYEKFGAIDSWVTNVGGVGHRGEEGYSESDVEEVTKLCFNSAVYGCQVAGTFMKRNASGGSIVTISSLAARCPTAGRSTLYGPLKAAVRHLAVTYAAEYAPWNIRVNSVLPGFTSTEAVMKNVSEQERLLINERTLLRRMAKTEEIAKPVVFLCSDAASYITATSLEVSGGREVVLNPEIAKP
nr:SDR family oxidoreductase [uncultured Sphaerochaeta sp.]